MPVAVPAPLAPSHSSPDAPFVSSDPTANSRLSLPFPPLTRSHIINCSYHAWYPRHKSLTPKSRLIPLSSAFVSYLRADGIVLPPEPSPFANDISGDIETDSGIFSGSDSPIEGGNVDYEDGAEEEDSDPSAEWADIHSRIQATIKELKGAVYPKLNWSAPKDATWINAGNTMECRSANDVYLLLKSSDFVTHDLEQAFNGCEESRNRDEEENAIPYSLVLRQRIPALVTSLEFRCFVRGRSLLCISQREMNHFPFLEGLLPTLADLIQRFFDDKIRDTFPDENFVFDVYVPPPHERCWLIDINPWAVRTDPLLFSWLEILGLPAPGDSTLDEESSDQGSYDGVLSSRSAHQPIFRLVNYGDPEAYGFNSARYSAHKLPKDVIDASIGNVDGEGGLRAFMNDWREVMKRQEEEEVRDVEEDVVTNVTGA